MMLQRDYVAWINLTERLFAEILDPYIRKSCTTSRSIYDSFHLYFARSLMAGLKLETVFLLLCIQNRIPSSMEVDIFENLYQFI